MLFLILFGWIEHPVLIQKEGSVYCKMVKCQLPPGILPFPIIMQGINFIRLNPGHLFKCFMSSFLFEKRTLSISKAKCQLTSYRNAQDFVRLLLSRHCINQSQILELVPKPPVFSSGWIERPNFNEKEGSDKLIQR